MPKAVVYKTSSNETAQVCYDQWNDSFQLYAVGSEGEPGGKQYYIGVSFSRVEFKEFLRRVNELESSTAETSKSDQE